MLRFRIFAVLYRYGSVHIGRSLLPDCAGGCFEDKSMNSVNKLLESVWLHEWDWYKNRKPRRLKNTDFTIISSNCVGTIIYHDMGLPFLTPTINLTISMRDLVKMAGNLRWYMDQELVEVRTRRRMSAQVYWGRYPVNFVHYGTFRRKRALGNGGKNESIGTISF